MEIPKIGLGTWQAKGDECKNAVLHALDVGYRHIDTAAMYGNHKEVGEALAETDVPRDSIWVTSKIWMDDLSYSGTKEQVRQMLSELQLDYLDLVLIHWPNSSFDMKDTFKALSELVDDGVIRHIGVSNFTIDHIKEAMQVSDKPIFMNQVEYHVYLQQTELRDFCFDNDIKMTAYCPLAQGDIFKDDMIIEEAMKARVTPAQLVLRYLLDEGLIVIPKSTNDKRIEENFDLDFVISEELKVKLNHLNIGRRLINPSFAEF